MQVRLQRSVLPDQKSSVPELPRVGVVLYREGNADGERQRPQRDVRDAEVRVPSPHQGQVGNHQSLLPRELPDVKVLTP